MAVETVPAAGTGLEAKSRYPPAESRRRLTALGHSPNAPARPTAYSRAATAFAGRATRAPYGPDFRRTSLVPCAFPASAGLPAGLPHMPV